MVIKKAKGTVTIKEHTTCSLAKLLINLNFISFVKIPINKSNGRNQRDW